MAENGKLDVSTLVQAANGAPGQVLEAQTAKQWAWMVSDAAAAGVHLAPEPDDGIASCYRDLANQQHAYDTLGYPAAAVPGTSNHGLGTAIDIALTSSITYWLQANSGKYGFVFDVANEPWHAHRTSTINPPAGKTGEDPMIIGIKGKSGARRGGSYLVIGTVASFIGTTIPTGVPTYTDEGEIKNIQSRISGLA